MNFPPFELTKKRQKQLLSLKKWLPRIGLVAAAYYVTGRLGQLVAIPPGTITAVWPPSAVALVAILRFGPRVWPGIWLGAFFVNIWIFFHDLSFSYISAAFFIGVGSTLQALLGAFLIRRFVPGKNLFHNVRSVFNFMGIAVLSCVVAPTFGVTALYLGEFIPGAAYGYTWLTWWIGDSVSIIVIVPVLLSGRKLWEAISEPLEAVKFSLFLGLVFAAAQIIFGSQFDMWNARYPIAYILVPFVIWGAFRFGQGGAVMSILIVSGIAIWGTVAGHSPFIAQTVNESLLMTQAFVSVISMMGLVLSAGLSERQAAEEVRSRLAAIVESSTDAIIGKNLGGSITSWNKGAEQLYGYTSEEVIGRHISILSPAGAKEEISEILAKLKRGGRIEDYETVQVRKDGRKVSVSVTISPMKDETGKVTGASAIARDITERKKSEEALRIANERLGELATLKDKFVALTSHELRTPLAAIKEGLSLFIDQMMGPLNAEQMDFLNTIDENVDRLTNLITNLLDLSKIEAGRIRLVRRSLSMNGLIEKTIHHYKMITGKRTVKTALPRVPNVFADPDRILQVLANLLSNAVKFTRSNGTITFSVKKQDSYVTVTVQDDGTGIAKEDLPKLFQKFSQVGEGESWQRGTGLGLVLCKELVELHKGSIEVRSELGRGSQFMFTLPCYTSKFALEESFEEQLSAAVQGKEEMVGLIVIDGRSFIKKLVSSDVTSVREECLEQAAAFVRERSRLEESVLYVEPHWIVVIVPADDKKVHIIANRLYETLREWTQTMADYNLPITLNLGTAIYPIHGTDVHTLFAFATAPMNLVLHGT